MIIALVGIVWSFGSAAVIWLFFGDGDWKPDHVWKSLFWLVINAVAGPPAIVFVVIWWAAVILVSPAIILASWLAPTKRSIGWSRKP